MNLARARVYNPRPVVRSQPTLLDLNFSDRPMTVTSVREAAFPEPDMRQIERANAIYRQPVIFLPRVRPAPGDWRLWAEIFEAAGYAALTPTWPNGLQVVSEDGLAAGDIPGGPVRQATDHFAGIAARLDRRPAIVGQGLGGLLVQTLADRGLSTATVAIDPVPSGAAKAISRHGARAAAALVLRTATADFDPGWRKMAETALEFIGQHARQHADMAAQQLGGGFMGQSAGGHRAPIIGIRRGSYAHRRRELAPIARLA